MEYVEASSPVHFQAALALIRSYLQFLGEDLSFQNTEQEALDLQAMYGAPAGALLLCQAPDGNYAGVVGVRKFGKSLQAGEQDNLAICEMKRLYVLPQYNGKGIGKKLSVTIINKARQLGYKTMVLDTLKRLQPALALYRKLGFEEIPAYYENPLPGVIYMRKNLN